MKRKFVTQTAFMGKSLLWSLLLYLAVMAVLNWDDIRKGREQEPQPWVQKSDPNRLVPVKVSVPDWIGKLFF
ncbi:MAG: hypothetical protein JNL72_14410 [Flavipsychrobacter sp.]|nr:hypothetical protein [Flavipsychrobacter sp.]